MSSPCASRRELFLSPGGLECYWKFFSQKPTWYYKILQNVNFKTCKQRWHCYFYPNGIQVFLAFRCTRCLLDFWRRGCTSVLVRGAQPTQPSVPRRGTIKQQAQQRPFETKIFDELRWFMTPSWDRVEINYGVWDDTVDWLRIFFVHFSACRIVLWRCQIVKFIYLQTDSMFSVLCRQSLVGLVSSLTWRCPSMKKMSLRLRSHSTKGI